MHYSIVTCDSQDNNQMSDADMVDTCARSRSSPTYKKTKGTGQRELPQHRIA